MKPNLFLLLFAIIVAAAAALVVYYEEPFKIPQQLPVVNVVSSTINPSSAVSIASIIPSSGTVGANIVISGSGFTGSNTVLMDSDVAARNVMLSSFTNGHQTLTFAVPSSLVPDCKPDQACPDYARLVTPATYAVSVQNSNGTSSTMPFTVTQ